MIFEPWVLILSLCVFLRVVVERHKTPRGTKFLPMRGKFPELGMVRSRHVWTFPDLTESHLREVGLSEVSREEPGGDPCMLSSAGAYEQASVLFCLRSATQSMNWASVIPVRLASSYTPYILRMSPQSLMAYWALDQPTILFRYGASFLPLPFALPDF